MAIWDDVLTEQDKLVFARSGHGRAAGLGRRPALLVIDVTYAFAGDRPEPILQSIERWPRSCGESAWQAVAHIQRLLSLARARAVPIFYTRPAPRQAGAHSGRQADKHARPAAGEGGAEDQARQFVAAIAPQPGDHVIDKPKPSAFFGTALVSSLVNLRIDTLILTGGTTSGCIRATAVDAYSYNYRAAVAAECVFDRGQTSHKIALFDLNAKYADVVSFEALEAFFEALASRPPG